LKLVFENYPKTKRVLIRMSSFFCLSNYRHIYLIFNVIYLINNHIIYIREFITRLYKRFIIVLIKNSLQFLPLNLKFFISLDDPVKYNQDNELNYKIFYFFRSIILNFIYFISIFINLQSLANAQSIYFDEKSFLSQIRVDGWSNAGLVVNFNQPKDGLNFGQQITEHTGLNFDQGVMRIYKNFTKENNLDFGFKYSGMLGNDADFVQLMGQTEYLMNGRVQFASPEAYIKLRMPSFWGYGLDLKLGQFLAYNSIESLYPTENFFFTHSYTSEFGPWTTTGALFETKLNENFDIYAGIVTGFNTSIGWPGAVNSSPGLHAGFNLSLFDDKLIISGANLSGPQHGKQLDPYNVGWPDGAVGGTPAECLCDPNNTWTFANNLMLTVYPTDQLTLMSDINYNRADLSGTISPFGISNKIISDLSQAGVDTPLLTLKRSVTSNSYGASVYGIYKINDSISVGTRAEFWRDDRNHFANIPLHPFDIANAIHSFPTSLFQLPFGTGTSYVEFTAGVKINAKLPENKYIPEIILRPQARWDACVNGKEPFFNANQFGGKSTQGMVTFDVIIPFNVN
jgi:Putative beta-barrel porin-2, OmpL-like. bbp2